MTDPVPQELIDAARAYEALFVPALFRQWAPRVLDAAGVAPGQRVLDVACGTGVLAREASARVGPSGAVAAIDPGAGMLAVGRELSPTVEFRLGVAESLPYADGSFDAVLSQFGLMFFTDRTQALREMLRVLAPGGRLAVAVWERLEASEAYRIEVELIEHLAGRAAADALRAPFALGDRLALTGLFEGAGATEVEVTTLPGTARFPSIRIMVEADPRGWLPVMGVVLREALIQRILEEAETALARYVTAGGQVAFDFPAHVVTAGKASAQV